MTFLQHLNVCNIESLEERRIKIDLIRMYKILHNLMSINLGNNINSVLTVILEVKCINCINVIFVCI